MRQIKNILFPVNFSPSCIAMTPYVKKAAALFGARVSLIHVFDPGSHSGFELYIRRSVEIAEEHQELHAIGSRPSSTLNFLSRSTPGSLLPGMWRHRSLRLPETVSTLSSCPRILVRSGGCSLALQQPRYSMTRIAWS
jgi:hypothetical protein